MALPALRCALATALAAMLLTSCGAKMPTEPSRFCRRYPTGFTENGLSYQCGLESNAMLTCRRGTTAQQSWQYGSLEDFIREAQIPNKLLVRQREVSSSPGMLVTFSQTVTDYRYDASGRLIERRRTRRTGLSSGFIDVDLVEYSAWDSQSRPTSGTIHVGDNAQPVTIAYDDRARHMEGSNGEAVTRDANGNVVSEVSVVGFGSANVFGYIIQSTAEACL
jgi:hypothetical protein